MTDLEFFIKEKKFYKLRKTKEGFGIKDQKSIILSVSNLSGKNIKNYIKKYKKIKKVFECNYYTLYRLFLNKKQLKNYK